MLNEMKMKRSLPTFQRNALPPTSWLKSMLGSLSVPDDIPLTLWNVPKIPPDYKLS
jgi:hypothetical protein